MNKDNGPNIFSYATSELTQDAFIGWLCAWANPKYKDLNPALNRTAKSLLEKFFSMQGKSLPEIKELKVITQWMRIDVFIEINEKYFVIIEDKVNSSEHSDQLNRYREFVKENKEVENDKIIPIFFKTGDQANYDKPEEDKYQVFKREDFLEILREGKEHGIHNAIYLEYLEYLEGMEREVELYKVLPPKEWNNSQWKGFFKFLNREFNESINWGYVSNPSGGFMAFWWNRKGDIDGHDIYLQIEGPKLCYKISSAPEGDIVQRDKKWEWLNLIREVASEMNLPVDKPARLGHGKWVTFAQWHAENSETWIPTKEDGSPDLEQAVERLKSATNLLDKTVQTYHG
ncbi:MAG: hypothetical protein CL666_07535 [Balneola sp.]|nr:hypothetical protein [Balneola sp.]|tara:strand:+ start:92770 stop:93801 length:1032 start_codon:yes stop_codon:yes gene_type:complete